MKLSYKEREKSEERKDGFVPGVLYGSGVDNVTLSVNLKEFNSVYEEAGETTLVSLMPEKESGNKYLVLINEIQRNPLTDEIIHIDFYQPNLTENVEVSIPLVFEGISPAVKELEGTLVKNFSEIEVKALPEKLPHEIKIDISSLATFEDVITVADIKIGDGVEILKESDEIVASVVPVEKEEDQGAITEDVEAVEKIAKKEKGVVEEEEK